MGVRRGLGVLGAGRELLAAVIYYVRPCPLDAVEWNPVRGITDQWRLSNNIGNHRGEDFLAVTQHGLVDEMRRCFAEMTLLTTIATDSGPGGGRTYTFYVARNFLRPGQPAVGAHCPPYQNCITPSVCNPPPPL